MNPNLEQSWHKALELEFSKPYFTKLVDFINAEYHSETVYPPVEQIFQSLNTTPLNQVKVVILGQDPYHGINQAMGLAFSVNDGVTMPPSLKNIYKELQSDLRLKPRPNGNLEAWANQGVLLLNATLTVRANAPGSHQNRGWEQFSDEIVAVLNRDKEHLVFMLWGKYAQDKGKLIDRHKHLVLVAPHPSPFSAHTGFLGCKHFSKCNQYLKQHQSEGIGW